MKTEKINSGRSMIEMLGVLAIIGVLSIGGLAGFKYASDKIKANRILSDASLAYASLVTQENTSSELTPLNMKTDSGLTFYSYRNETGEDFIQTSGITKDVCEKILSQDGSNNLKVYTSAGAAFTTCADDNTMMFGFSGTPIRIIIRERGDDKN